MVKIADRAGIPCYLKPEQLPWYRDKSATRALLTELGLPTPGFRKIPIAYFKDRSKRTQLQELLEGLRYPVVHWINTAPAGSIYPKIWRS